MTTAAELVAQAKANVTALTPQEVADRVAGGDTVVVDLREPAEIEATGKIPGAVQAPRGMLEFFADPASPYHKAELDPSKPTILYCASGGRSALSAMTLKQLGYSDVAHLEGGIGAWKEAGNDTEQG